jgi:aspartyl-tRNA(Asn)/glutamyl-tRNA(Gln) amidotransferase subunit A
MLATDLTGITIARAAAAIRARDVSPLELTEAYLRRIEQLDPAINAYITVTADRARADAQRATDELARGVDRGPLHGVPVALKDLFNTAGIRTTAGSKIHAGFVPEADSTAARRLAEAGTVLLGKLNTHEYAYGGTTNNPHYGPTRNPWNLDCIPGGSSGGSGAAIAAGLATATLGTDTAGSIRMPAALCGIVGLKPTYGRVSKAGVAPLSWTFDHPGPMTRTVEDAALILNVIAGYDPDDYATVPVPVPDYTATLGDGVAGLRIGVIRNHFFDLLDPDVRAAVETAIGVLRDLGADVRDLTIPGIEGLAQAQRSFTILEARDIHRAGLADRIDDFGADVRERLSTPYAAPEEIAAGLRHIRELTETVRRLLATEYDLFLTPTMVLPAPPIGAERVTVDGNEEAVGLLLIRETLPFNATHLPALSVPCGLTRGGLPVGLQLAGRPFDEATVLRAGHAYEQATDWHQRHPAL